MSTNRLTSPPGTSLPVVPPKRRRRWLKLTLGLVCLLAVLVAVAPIIVARTPLRNRIASAAIADLQGTVEVGGASLSWFSPIELRDLTVKDARGRTLLVAARVTSSKSLFALARDRSDLGEFTVERPVLDVVCENGTTNLETALADILKVDGTPDAPTRTAVTMRITDGAIAVHDSANVSKFEAVAASVIVPRDRSEAVVVQLATKSGSGTLDADFSLGTSGKVVVNATAFPLDSLSPAIRRLDPSISISGALTATLSANWAGTGDAIKLSVDGTAAIKQLDLGGPWLTGDRLQLAFVETPLKLEAIGNAIRIDRADITCEIGKLSIAGTFDSDASLDHLLAQPGVKVEGDIDLAKLAAKLPRLLRIRDGVAVTEGNLHVNVNSRGTPAAWSGEVRTSALKARRADRIIEWKEPFAFEFTGRFRAGELPTFDKFVCRSDFIALNARSDPETIRLGANVSLDALSHHLSEFVDFGGASLSGTAGVKLILKRNANGEFKLDSSLDLNGFAYSDSAGRGFREEAASLRIWGHGLAPRSGPMRIDNSGLDLIAGNDELHLGQSGVIPDARHLATATYSARYAGDLGRWMNRVRGVVKVPTKYLFGGALTGSGVVTATREKVSVTRLTVVIEKARFRGAGLDFDEPTLSAVADLSVHRVNGNLLFDNFQISCEPLRVDNGKLTIETQPNGELAVFGGGSARTDLTRLSKTLKLSSDPRGGDTLHGRGSGPVHFRWSGTTTTFNGILDVKEFAYGNPKETGIAEPNLRLETDGKYEETSDTLSFAKARIQRSGLIADAKGTFAKFDTTKDVFVDGTLNYDLEKLSPDFRTAVGGSFDATGKGVRPFSVKGSLSPGELAVNVGGPKAPRPGPFSKLSAEGSIAWDSVKAYGFEMGPSEFNGRLANGTLYVSPIRASFAGSQIALAPTVRLDPDPAEMTFAKGKIVDRSKLTPQALAGGLGYVMPAIANAAQAEGEITMILGENRVPLSDFSKTTLEAQVVVHKATVSAGPLVTELSQLLGGPPTQLTLANEMTVPVRVEHGRVHHENFTMSFNGFTVKTSGSVGFDGSLALSADLPVPAAVFKNNPRLMQALAGKRVQIPITGTVSKPVIDPRLFQAAVSNLAKNAVTDIGKDVLNKELEKLLPGSTGGPGVFPYPLKK